MFAFAVWDRERQELFCARDRFGVKPFYYTVVDGRFRFASEIKALLVDEAVPRRAERRARRPTSSPSDITDHTAETLFEGILQLPPGSFFVVEHGTPSRRRRGGTSLPPADLAGAAPVDALRDRLVDAVALRLRSDVPVGTTVSGGLDSSAVTAIATKLRREDGLEPAPTFSSRCEDPRIDEWPYIEKVLETTGRAERGLLPERERPALEPRPCPLAHGRAVPRASVFGSLEALCARALERRHRAPRRPGRRRGARGLRVPPLPGPLLHLPFEGPCLARGQRGAVPQPNPGCTAAALGEAGAEGLPPGARPRATPARLAP